MGELFSRVVLPVASEDDARTTCDAVLPHIAEVDGSVVAVHVIEKAGGAPDKASVEQREGYAEDVFAIVENACREAGVTVETEHRFDTDVVDAVFEAARDHDVSAVAFTPRGGSRWLDVLTGSHSRGLVKRADLPVVVFPAEGDDE